MNDKKLLSISTDRRIFEKGSDVSNRLIELYRSWKEVHIIVFTDQSFSETSLGDNIFVYPTQSHSKWKYPFDATRLGRFIISKRDITDITSQDPFLTAMAAISLKKQFGINLEIQVHTDIGSPNFTYSIGNRVRKFLALNYLPKADSIRVVSNRIKSYLVEKLGIAAEKITVRPIHVDVERIKNAPIIEGADLHKKYPQFEKIILVASRLEPEKNVSLALHAFALADARPKKVGLVIVGSGSQLDHLKKLASSLGIGESVIFEPWIDAAKLASYYKTADLFLNTSLYEGYGMTLVEAHAAGCPIVSTDVGIAKEVGAVIAKNDANDISDKLKASLQAISD